MSTSETITRTDLTNILNEVLPPSLYIQSWEYVGDKYWWSSTWTVPDDGFIEVVAEPSAANWYLRISDTKAPDTGWSHRMAGANTLTVSQIFFVKAGAVLGTYSMASVTTVHVYYYRFVLKETNPAPLQIEYVTSGNVSLHFYKAGNVVQVQSWGSFPATNDGVTIATIPSGFRPVNSSDFTVFNTDGSRLGIIRFNANGAIAPTFGNLTAGAVRGCWTYICN